MKKLTREQVGNKQLGMTVRKLHQENLMEGSRDRGNMMEEPVKMKTNGSIQMLIKMRRWQGVLSNVRTTGEVSRKRKSRRLKADRRGARMAGRIRTEQKRIMTPELLNPKGCFPNSYQWKTENTLMTILFSTLQKLSYSLNVFTLCAHLSEF